jgi:hypothetical protein
MRRVSVLLPEHKVIFFLDLLKSLDFVQAFHAQNGDVIPNWKREIVDQRILEYKENPDDSLDWETLSNVIK